MIISILAKKEKRIFPQCLTKKEYHISTGNIRILNQRINLFTSIGRLIDFLNSIIKTKAAFNKIATIKPSITIVPSTTCKGITAFVFPFLRIPNSTNRRIAEMIKHMLQMNNILEKKRKGKNCEW